MKKLWNSLAMILAVAMTMSFAACSSSDDDSKTEEVKKETTGTTGTSNVSYMVYASPDIINYFDLVMSYTDKEGATQKKTLTKSDFKDKTINGVAIPCAEVKVGEVTLATETSKNFNSSITLQRNSNTETFTKFVKMLGVYISATNAEARIEKKSSSNVNHTNVLDSKAFLESLVISYSSGQVCNYRMYYDATGKNVDGNADSEFVEQYKQYVYGWKSGATVDLANTRAFILNEGTMGKNNSNMIYFDWTTNKINTSCIYNQQNGKAIGDTGNDLIVFGEDLLLAVNNSNYVAWLNGSAVEKKRLSFAQYSNLGLVRDVTFDNDNSIFVSTTSGYVVALENTDGKFAFDDSIKVGAYPEDILYNYKDDKVYCAVSGWGSDNRVAVIDGSARKVKSYIDVMVNPNNLVQCDGHIFVQGYGPYAADYSCPYPWGEITSGTYKELGNASAIAAGNGKVFTALSKTDWTTYTTTTTLAVYDVKTGTTDTGFFKNAPASIATTNVYSISVNPYNNYVYVASGDGYSEGTIHVFDADGNYKASFSSNGYCPNTIVFLKN